MKTLKESTTFSTELGNLVAPYLNYADAEAITSRGTFEEKRFVHELNYLFENDKLNDKNLPLLVWWLKNSRTVYIRTSEEGKVERDHFSLIVDIPNSGVFTTEYSEGEGLRIVKKFSNGVKENMKSPSRVDMLWCLLTDASIVENCTDFADFCSELGYDEDSRKAEKSFKECCKTLKALKQMFSAEELETLKETFEDY